MKMKGRNLNKLNEDLRFQSSKKINTNTKMRKGSS